MNLSIHGAVILARDFSVAVKEGKQLSGNPRRKYDSRAERRDVKNDLASFHRIMRHQVRLIYCQGQGEERRGEIAATGRRQPRRQGKEGGGRGSGRGTERCDETRSGKRSGEIKRRTKRERRIIDGRRRLPEDYSRKAAVYSIWQA